MEDRRTARRFVMNLPLQLRVAAPEGPQDLNARTRDLSYRGLYFTLHPCVEAGSRIEFVLTLPKEITLSGDVRVQCAGRVVRVEPVAGVEASSEAGQVGVAAVIEQYDFLPPTS